jgi:hypothetical protein
MLFRKSSGARRSSEGNKNKKGNQAESGNGILAENVFPKRYKKSSDAQKETRRREGMIRRVDWK